MELALFEPRSYLYVPGDRPDRFAKAVASGADAIVLDLEDGVRPGAKQAAREAVVAYLSSLGQPRCEHWVRINSDDNAESDLVAIVRLPSLAGVFVPKIELSLLDRLTGVLDRVPVCGLIETAAGILSAAAAAADERVVRLNIGEVDLCADLGIDVTRVTHQLSSLRMQVVVASAAAGLYGPIGPVSTALHDLDLFRAQTEELWAAGFFARQAIHPSQVPVVNEVLSPRPDDVGRAEALLEGAIESGDGVFVDADGRMVDEAVFEMGPTDYCPCWRFAVGSLKHHSLERQNGCARTCSPRRGLRTARCRRPTKGGRWQAPTGSGGLTTTSAADGGGHRAIRGAGVVDGHCAWRCPGPSCCRP